MVNNTFKVGGDLVFLEYYRIGTQRHLGYIPYANEPESLCGLRISCAADDLHIVLTSKEFPLDKVCLKCIARERYRR